MDYEVIEAEIVDDLSDIKSGKSELSNTDSNHNNLENALRDSNSLIIRKVYSSRITDFVIANTFWFDIMDSIPKTASGICIYNLYVKCGNGNEFMFDIYTQTVRFPCKIKPESKAKIENNIMYFDTSNPKGALNLNDVYPPKPEEWYDDEVSRKYSEKLIELSDIVKKYGFTIDRKLFYKLCNTPSFMEIYLEKEDSDSKLMEKLEKIIALHDSGKLSDEEFKLLKEKLIRTS